MDAFKNNESAFRYIDNVFSKLQWTLIDSINKEIACQPSLLESIKKGVGRLKNNKFSLNLHRFIARENGVSRITGSPYTQRIIEVINNSSLIEEVNRLVCKEVKILRMQFNIMSAGDFISAHFDKESDDSYLYALLIRTNSQYTGGDLTIYDIDQRPHIIRQPDHSILVMNSQCIHKVDPILSGNRYTLCVFLG